MTGCKGKRGGGEVVKRVKGRMVRYRKSDNELEKELWRGVGGLGENGGVLVLSVGETGQALS